MDNGADSYRRFLEGDESALTALVTAYRPGLRGYLNGIVHDWDLADDLTQETFVKLCLKKPRDKGTASFKTWLYTIGRRTALDYLRRNKIAGVPLEDCFSLADDDTPESAVLRTQTNERLYAALGTLQPQHRQLLYLIYFPHITQVSERFSCSKGMHLLVALNSSLTLSSHSWHPHHIALTKPFVSLKLSANSSLL